ncbi:MAG: ABC transporter ATP-binding protein [Candidatus Methanosuratincola sp.]|uniref:Oligopeptide transport ATP-binding protein OppD n=1 Tax=Methanosuratincola subterraneus TaxID=2593994 RepID=A0A3S3RBQ6_METS7|nr:ABC transporter ATP-binding protein [Candidatus Methanosuratincola sp.]RWX73108.1 MAG: Oligopeptide transport ATP-binding protein OppD [Candidatus Methanosuratincola subterraneus]
MDLLQVNDLKTYFFTEAGVVKAVDGITFNVEKGCTVGLVGESGSGKSVTAQSVLRIVPRPGKIIGGKIFFNGEDILSKKEDEMRSYRGKKISLIFQDPTSSLNPVFTIGSQLTEIVSQHKGVKKSDAAEEVIKALSLVRLPDPEEALNRYPHQFSGGMKQRICIARALLLNPELLFADEPTTNLDVTIQAQIINLLMELQKNIGLTLVMITHDMGIVTQMCKCVVVLYAGNVMEIGSIEQIFQMPHPYTEALLKAVPRLDQTRKLVSIPGNIPNLINPPSGCRFHPRCQYAIDRCKDEIPPLIDVGDGHMISCHRWRELNGG